MENSDIPTEQTNVFTDPEGFGAAEQQDNQSSISWSASEFIAHSKTAGWYISLAVCALFLSGVIYFLTRDPVSVAVIVVGAALLGIYGSHQPRQLEYQLDNSGINIGEKQFHYQQFRSFAVIPEGAFESVVFMPLKRFAVPITIYFPPEQEKQIVQLLASHLPLEEQGHDIIDRFLQRIRF